MGRLVESDELLLPTTTSASAKLSKTMRSFVSGRIDGLQELCTHEVVGGISSCLQSLAVSLTLSRPKQEVSPTDGGNMCLAVGIHLLRSAAIRVGTKKGDTLLNSSHCCRTYRPKETKDAVLLRHTLIILTGLART